MYVCMCAYIYMCVCTFTCMVLTQVSKYFGEVFKELVAGGTAKLVMQTREEAAPADDTEGAAEDAHKKVYVCIMRDV